MRRTKRHSPGPVVFVFPALVLLAFLAMPCSTAQARTEAPLYCWQSHPRYVNCTIIHIGAAQTRVYCIPYGDQRVTQGWICVPGVSSNLSAAGGSTCSAAGERVTLPVGVGNEDVCAALCGNCPASQWRSDPPPDNPNVY